VDIGREWTHNNTNLIFQKTEPEEKGRFKNCVCSPYLYNTADAGLTTGTQYDLNYISQHLLTWKDKYDLMDQLPMYQKSSLAVSKNTTELNVADAIESFCTTYNGTQLNMPLQDGVFKFGVDTVYDIFPLSDTSAFWLSANFHRGASSYCKSQQGGVAMAYDDCSLVLNYAEVEHFDSYSTTLDDYPLSYLCQSHITFSQIFMLTHSLLNQTKQLRQERYHDPWQRRDRWLHKLQHYERPG
jgi:hypothetical protein